MIESKYLEFLYMDKTKKTEIYGVGSKNHGILLGEIKWFGRWRQYCFFPYKNTVFNIGCLNDINAFIKELMEERKRPK